MPVSSPKSIIIFGATGDLMQKKIVPALYHLYKNKKLPKDFHIIGVARKKYTDKMFQKKIYENLCSHIKKINKKDAENICKQASYVQVDFKNTKDFAKLQKHLDAIDKQKKHCRLFYLAVPPLHFENIFVGMHANKLQTEGAKLLIEKPFGKDTQSTKKLLKLTEKYFSSDSLYFIDHYLQKEILQAIESFRFSNNLFEKSWGKNSIERIDIRLLEKSGVENRGAFYDSIGAFRDVMQNHLLQMLAAVTMDTPRQVCPKEIRKLRAEVLESLDSWTPAKIKKQSFRAQYNGYKKIKGVKKNSQKETYAKIETKLHHPNWKHVSIVLEAGKAQKQEIKEIIVKFRHPSRCVSCTTSKHLHNKVVFSFAPNDSISIHFWTKKPGFKKELEERKFDFFLYKRKEKTQYVEEYAKIIYQALEGEQSSFVSREEILAEWKFTDPLIKAWEKNIIPLESYSTGTENIRKKSAYIGEKAKKDSIEKSMAIIGLGKMGANMAQNMISRGWKVVGYNRTKEKTEELSKEGIIPAYNINEMLHKLPKQKIIWLMVPAGKAVDEVLFGKNGIAKKLKKGDVIIDGGNSFYKNTIKRAKKLEKLGISFLDVGTSGGPEGALRGACLMIGGKKKDFQKLEELFYDFATEEGYQFFEGAGAGHFVKMVHNGIEYGMMQAIAEGFNMMKQSKMKLDLERVAKVYNHGSVVESKLIEWLEDAFIEYGADLKKISSSVGQLGEGAWTVETAKKMKLPVKVIEEALKFRNTSAKNPSYTGKIVSALRGQFGGHPVEKK